MEYHSIITGFGILNRTFLKYISHAIAGWDISCSDSIFLVIIGSQEEIANYLAIDTASVARSVKHPVQQGYVRAEPCAEDRRVRLLYLTDTGRELCLYQQQSNR